MSGLTLVLQLAGPMQSWGLGGVRDRRTTHTTPSKSGVCGLLAAALGRGFGAPRDDLAALDMAVRVDAEGSLLVDFHTADYGRANPQVTRREYLVDANFLVFLAGDDGLLRRLAAAVRKPRYALSLGRRLCTPSVPVFLTLTEDNIDTALATVEGRPYGEPAPWPRRVVRDAPDGIDGFLGVQFLPDMPGRTGLADRSFTLRPVVERLVEREGQPQ